MQHAIKGLQPNKNEGMVFIVMFINGVDRLKKKGAPVIKRHLQWIFDERANDLSDKYTFDDFGGFFLNLDTKNQNKLLYDFGFDENFLRLPEIEKWKDLGIVAGMNDWEDGYNIEDVRMMGTTWFNEWDIYPHALVWIRRFMLYACNNGIQDKEYAGEIFGNYTNWAAYYLQLHLDKRKEFTTSLINYN